MEFSEYFNEFPIKKEWVFMNHCAVSPIPNRSKALAEEFLSQVSLSGSYKWNQWMEIVENTRSQIARLIHCDSNDVAFIKNTTEGLLKVANAIHWKPGQNVIVFDKEFPANIYPWTNLEKLGVEVRIIPETNYGYDLNRIKEKIDSNTRLLAISFVEYTTGYKNNLQALGKLCQENNTLFVVDGIQGVGACPIDVKSLHIDFMACEGQKWLLSTEGIGFMYCHQKAKSKLDFHNFGYNGVIDPENFLLFNQKPADGAREFEEGSLNLLGIHLMNGSLSLFNEIGVENIYSHIIMLHDRLIQGLKQKGYTIISDFPMENRSGIVSFYKKGLDSFEMFHQLIKQKIMISVRRDWLRVAPHFYNEEKDIDALLSLL